MKKDMETIKVYESYWKSDTDLALSLTICIWVVYTILKSGYEYSGMILLGLFGFFVIVNIFKRILVSDTLKTFILANRMRFMSTTWR